MLLMILSTVMYLYIDTVRASQETHLLASMACIVDGFTLYIYIDTVLTSQETHLRTSTTSYWDGYSLYLLFFCALKDVSQFLQRCLRLSNCIHLCM
jgi:hypothetical protein